MKRRSSSVGSFGGAGGLFAFKTTLGGNMTLRTDGV